MAIVKMKKLRLMAVRSQKQKLMRELLRLGCVEFSELDDELREEGLESILQRESSELLNCKSRQGELVRAVEILDRYVPEKKPLLSAKPEVEGETVISEAGLDKALDNARSIIAADETVRRISAEESRQRSISDSLLPWLSLELPLSCDGTERCSLVLGSFTKKVSLDDVRDALQAVTDEVELSLISDDDSHNYVALLCLREKLQELQECLRGFGFSAVSFSGTESTPMEALAAAEKELERLGAEKSRECEYIASMSELRGELMLAADKMSTKTALCQAEDRLFGTESAVVMQGWFPAEKEEELCEALKGFDCAWESEDPLEEEYPMVPIKLKNNKFTNALNMVTNMYSLPAYDGVDPNPLMAPFFILFYGLMMADMGYGLIMVAAALIAMAKIKPRKGSLSFCQLLLYGGISTFVMGALTGGFFGNALEQIGKILGKGEGWGVLPSLFNPMTDSMLVLIGSMALGLLHLNTGMVISAVEKVKKGAFWDAFWEEGALWVTLVGIILAVLKVGSVAGVPVVLVVGVLMVLYGGSRGATGLGKLTSVFGTLYNQVTGWFGDILSYSRIMALMLAGSVIATVFNTIGAIANNLVFFFVIFIIGHTLNFALNLLGCYVHDLRLQCLEYFGKFYKDGGRPFEPLEIKTNYYNIVEE